MEGQNLKVGEVGGGASGSSEPVAAIHVDQNQPGAWGALPVLMLLSALSLMDRQILSLMVEPIKRDLQITDFQVGLLQGIVFALFYCIAGLPLGWLADRYARRPVIWAGVAVWSMAASACGMATTYLNLVLARMFVGVGEASLSPAANSMLADLFRPARLALAFSVLSVGASIGNGLALGLGGMIVDFADKGGTLSLPFFGELYSWQFVFLITGLPGLLLCWLIFLVPEPVRRSRMSTQQNAGFGLTLKFVKKNWKFFTTHFVGFGLFSIVAWSYISWLPTFMIRKYGWDVGQVSLPLAFIIALGGICGTVASGALVDAWFGRGRKDAHFRMYAFISLGVAVIGAIAFQMPNPYLFLALSVPVASTIILAPTATAALQIVTPNEMRGQVNALFLLVMNGVGLGLGPPLVGAITDFLFHDEARVGDSMSIVCLTLGPLAALALFVGCKSMRGCVDQAAAWRS